MIDTETKKLLEDLIIEAREKSTYTYKLLGLNKLNTSKKCSEEVGKLIQNLPEEKRKLLVNVRSDDLKELLIFDNWINPRPINKTKRKRRRATSHGRI